MDLGDFGEHNRTYITEYIKFGDAKAGAILTVVGIVVGVLGAAFPGFLAAASTASCPWQVLGFLLGTCVAISGVMTIWFSIAALTPNTAPAEKSLASFPDIASWTPEEHKARVAALTRDEIGAEYAAVNSKLSKIAHAKFAAIRSAVQSLRVFLISAYGIALTYGVREMTK